MNTLDYSLDLIKLREVYERVYRRMDFGFFVGDKEYTQRVINVTFKYSVKEYNEIRKGLYIKFGYSISDVTICDGVDVRDGELVAIQVGCDIQNPIVDEILGKYFWYEDGQYKAKRNIAALKSVADLRNELYDKGFYCNGIHYIRFKRSSGSSRVGKCLFIDEKLYPRMHKWELCGLKVKDGQEIDLAALEAYIALTLSSIIDTIEINPENILLIDDYESVFRDDVIAVSADDNGNLTAAPENVEISNSIWDGQSLMDKSLFGKYQQYGMLLLRNRFFKSCCFNCNIQKFFADNGITDVSQLNGKTLATNIEDVKLITTPSSIKYLKFGTFENWLKNLDSLFGVVKHEKKTHFFDGRLVQTHYQLINTIQMSYEDVEEFLEPSLSYLKLLNNEPAVLRNHIKYPVAQEFRLPLTALESKNDIVYKLMGLNDKFCHTKLYTDFRNDLTKSFIKNLKNGHVLVNGNYSTLCGNPVEMLMQSIGLFDGTPIISIGRVYSTRFEFGKTILGSRSPHINPGNILLTRNTYVDEISRYCNVTEEIVCINAIGENIQQRLNGSDYDSDTIMLTDNSVLIKNALKNYDKFLVPTSFVSSIKRKRLYTDSQKADLDIKTSVNKIGEIVNLSQEINTLMWDKISSGETFEDVFDLYVDSSVLCIMSGLEIDAAKKEFKVSNTEELKKLKTKYNRKDKSGRLIKPNFFGHISKAKGYYDTSKKNYKRHDTSMDYLQKVINKYHYQKCTNDEIVPFSDIVDQSNFNISRVKYYTVNRVINIVRRTRENIAKVWTLHNEINSSDPEDTKLSVQLSNNLRQDCVDFINGLYFNYSTMYWLLISIESKEYSDIKKTIFNTLFGSPNLSFYNLIKQSATPISVLEPDRYGDISIYGIKYSITTQHYTNTKIA